jgi:FkbM family methyltransferase
MEALLRKLIPKLKLYNFRFIVLAYEKYAVIRYRKKFESEIEFRGSKFIVGKDVTLFPSVYQNTYEKCELDILLSMYFPNNLVFWDIGANVGLYSVLFGKKYPDGKVISFEPNFALHSLLENNFALNGISNYLIEGIALSSKSGVGEMYAKDSRPGAGRIKEHLDTSNPGYNFEIVIADEYLQSHPKLVPGLIKIDVEGHEPEVIRGMIAILSLHKPTLTIEVFKNLWESDRGRLWEETFISLFEIYGESLLITDGVSKKILDWSPNYLSGGMQTLIFGLDNVTN